MHEKEIFDYIFFKKTKKKEIIIYQNMSLKKAKRI
jgi:hypothetical protein